MLDNVGKKYLIIYKNSGKFYNVYKDDAYILNYLFGYKVLDKRKSGFPDSAITKVTNMLEEKKISYQIIYDDKDPFVKNYRNLNCYEEYMKKAMDKIDIKERMEVLENKIKGLDNEKLKKIIEAIELCLE